MWNVLEYSFEQEGYYKKFLIHIQIGQGSKDMSSHKPKPKFFI